MSSDMHDLNLVLLTSVLAIQEPYFDVEEAAAKRKYWRSLARKNHIKIRTYDVPRMSLIIIVRETPLPGDDRIRQMNRQYDAELINRHIDKGTAGTSRLET